MRQHLLNGFERHFRPGRTIYANYIHRPLAQLAGEYLGGGAIQQLAVVVHRHLRDNDHFRSGGFAGGVDRFA